MKSYHLTFRNFRLIFLLAVIPFPTVLSAADILYEHNWTRIITGDRATQLTREIGEKPQPTDISAKTIKTVLISIGLPEQNSLQIKAWHDGLKRYGWVQQENEPEYEPYCVTQLIVADDKLVVKIYRYYGQTTEAIFDLNGIQLSGKKIEIPETLDRTVFHTVRSPALFILNQEHFQKHFFEGMLNLDFPGLEAVKRAYESKKILLAAHETAEYFRRQTHPIWPVKEPEKIASTDEPAEKVLRHEFSYRDSTIYLGERIDFQHNPTNDNEWIWGLNRMNHWVTLLTGYLKTGNEAYAREYNEQVIDWIVRNPAPPFQLTRVPSWRNLEAGIRIAGSWPRTFFGFMVSPSFQTQAIQLMLASIWSHAEYILRFPSGMRFVNNWVIIESNGLASVGMSFPEFKHAKVWAETGLQRLSDQLDKQIYPDGTQHELATAYHISCMHNFHQAYELALKTHTPIPQNFSSTLEKMFEYIMYISTPLRQIPPTNDSHRHNIANWMTIGADQFNREDMCFVATNGQAGQPPAHTSAHFPWGGHSAMRSDWSSEAWYLFFDAGPTGVSHQHEDMLHIDVSAYGRDFLTDGGKGLYIPDKWRNYFVSTRAHNTILIDGQEQLRLSLNETHRAKSPLTNRWLSDDRLDFASGAYDHGYGAKRIAVVHSRYVIFKKKEYWFVIDYLTGKGQHEFDALYHFMPGEIEVDDSHNSVRTLHRDGKNIKLVSAATVPLKIEVVQGQENPEQGWISLETGERVAAPTVIFNGQGKLPVLIATVIQPFTDEAGSEIGIKFQKSPSYQADVIVSADWGEDRWLINLENANHIFIAGVEKIACLSFCRKKDRLIAEEFIAKFSD